jgi:hypothetical protein
MAQPDGPYEVVVEPPYYDDQWACIWARFDRNEFWHAESKDDALERLQAKAEEPEGRTYPVTPLPADSIEINAHPDYEDAITPTEIAGGGLATFGVSGGGPFGTGDSHWRFSHRGYDKVVVPLVNSDGPEVVQLSVASECNSTPDSWPWDRRVWIRDSVDSGFDLWVHRAADYDWASWEGVDASTIVRVLDGDWPSTFGDIETVVRYRTIAGSEDEPTHLEWGGLEAAAVEYLKSHEGTPFDDGFAFAPAAGDRVNGWVYEPDSHSHRESWVGPKGETDVTVHHHQDFSWFTVRDRRLGGAGSRITPDSYPSKRQAEFTPEEARAAATEWMRTHDPDLWSHDAYREELTAAPDGWELLKRPAVSQSRPTEVYVALVQPAKGDVSRVLRVAGTVGKEDADIELEYRHPSESDHIQYETLYSEENPVELPDKPTIVRVYKAACEFARTFRQGHLGGEVPDSLTTLA